MSSATVWHSQTVTNQSDLKQHRSSSFSRLVQVAIGIGCFACIGVSTYALYTHYRNRYRFSSSKSLSNAHEKKLGWLDKWYSQQLPTERRVFVEALRVIGPQPSLLDIRMVLSQLSFEHPTLSVYPSVDGEYFHSHLQHEARSAHSQQQQQELSDCSDQPSVTLPCAFLNSAVFFIHRIDNTTIDTVIEDELNRPFPIRSADDKVVDWHGYRVTIVANTNVPDSAPNESKLSSTSEYELVVTMQHLTGDGMSGLILLRSILAKLSERLSLASESIPQTCVKSLNDALPISQYKLLDEYLDVTTKSEPISTLSSKFLAWLQAVAQRIRLRDISRTGKVAPAARSFWNGPSSLPIMSGPQTTGYLTLQLSSPVLKDLLRACKERGVTLQGLVTAAAQFATASVALRAEPELASEPLCVSIGTPVSLRGQCHEPRTPHAATDSVSWSQPPLKDQIGNFVWAMYWPLEVIVGQTSLFARASEYLSELRRRLPNAYHGIGQLSERGIRGQVEHTRSQTKNMRTCSVLVSNLGVLESTISKDATPLFSIMQAYFANAAHYFLAVFVNSIVSSSSGGLSIGVSFAKEIVSPTMATDYVCALERTLIQVTNLKKDQDLVFSLDVNQES